MKKIVHLISTFAFLIFLIACNNMNQQNNYGEKVNYKMDQVISFPDFDLEYLGERREHVEVFGRDFTYYDFKISREGEMQTVRWSAGTGDIGPALFTFGDKEYFLERDTSDIEGRLGSRELIIWEKEVFMEKMNEPME